MDNMKAHFSKQQWMDFLLGADIDRAPMDSHLEHCESCRMMYIQVIETQGDHLPELADAGKFADDVARRLEGRAAVKPSAAVKTSAAGKLGAAGKPSATGKPSAASSRRRPLVQYAIAASLTILLVGSGAFQQLFHTLDHLTSQLEDGTKPAIAQRLTDHTVRWLDGIPAMNKRLGEGNR